MSARSPRARSTLLPIFLLSLAAGSCRTLVPSVDPFLPGTGARQIHIQVRNDNFYDATIWVVASGARQSRLGMVRGKEEAEFVTAWNVPRPLQFDVDLLASNTTCRTEALIVAPGDNLELRISSALGQIRGCGGGWSTFHVGGTESRSGVSGPPSSDPI